MKFLFAICLLVSSHLLTAQDFEQTRHFGDAGTVFNAVIEDVDGDMSQDVVAVFQKAIAFEPFLYEILLFSNLEGIPEEMDSVVLYATETFLVHLAVFDVNGDGRPDIIFTEGDDRIMSVMLNTSEGFEEPELTDLQGFNQWKPIDVNQDGINEILAFRPAEGLSLLSLADDGQFSEVPFMQDEFSIVSDFDVADVDTDGDLDILISDRVSGEGRLSLLLNDGEGEFVENEIYRYRSEIRSFKLLDYDGDQLLDIVGLSSPQIMILKNLGDNSFEEMFLGRVEGLASGFTGRSLEVADLTGDGRSEIIVGVNEDANLWINVVSADPVELEVNTVGRASQAMTVETGDLDADGDQDIIILNGDLHIFENIIPQMTTSTVEVIQAGGFYPNPAQDFILIEDLYSGNTLYKIFDFSGRFVQRGTVNANKIDLSTLNGGQYTIELTNETDQSRMILPLVKI